MTELSLLGLPMSISVNASLKPRLGDGRLVKTKASTIFDRKMWSYAIKNQKQIIFLKDYLLSELSNDTLSVIHLTRIYYLNEKRVLCKSKKAKFPLQKFDVSNLMKIGEDGISKLICVDDRYFKVHTVDMRLIGDNENEYIDAFFKLTKLQRKIYEKL